ncbi:MAG TPA: hypothetical protein EYP85_08065 [Armatimonadetes bacterium]|nr:hypothetical protein [Armatimonadota bacterium]
MVDKRVTIGTARVNITPPLSIPYLGIVPRQDYFTGVHDPLWAKAWVVDDGETSVAIITADAIGFSNQILGPGRNFTAEVRERVQALTGIPAQNVMLAASHAHSTPETINLTRLLDVPAARPWLEVLKEQLASAAAWAANQRRAGTLKVGVGKAEGIGWNRRILGRDGRLYHYYNRPPDDQIVRWGERDPTVGVLLFEGEDGTCSVLSNFTCHPTTVQVQPLVSADYPGAATALVEQAMPGCTACLFTQGAGGNVNPVRGTTDFADVARYGLILGGEILQVVGRLRAPEVEPEPARVAVAAASVALPVRDLPPLEPAQAAYERAQEAVRQARTEEEKRGARLALKRAWDELDLIQRGSEPLPAEVQVLWLGRAALVAVPGELFVEFGLEIKARSPAPQTLVVGYANDYLGYIVTPETFTEGGYEASLGPWTRVGPAGGGMVVEKAIELLQASSP